MQDDSQNIKLLIADDEQIGRQLLEAIFFTENFELSFAEDGNQALQIAKEFQPELILLDVMMPGIDGFEVCRKIRSDALLKDVPIILITALEDRDSRIKGLESGANDYISKPFDRIEILSKVKNLTGLNRNKTSNSKDIPVTVKPDTSETLDLDNYFAGLYTVNTPSESYIKSLFPNHLVFKQGIADLTGTHYYIDKMGNFTLISLITPKNREHIQQFHALLLQGSLLKVFHAGNFSSAEELLHNAINEIIRMDGTGPEITEENNNLPLITLCLLSDNEIMQFAGFSHGIYIKNDDQFVRIIKNADNLNFNETTVAGQDYKLTVPKNGQLFLISDFIIRSLIKNNSQALFEIRLKGLIISAEEELMNKNEVVLSRYMSEVFKPDNQESDDIFLLGIKF